MKEPLKITVRDLPEDIIREITDSCFFAHSEEIAAQNLLHQEEMKKLIWKRAGLPVTIASSLILALIGVIWDVGMRTTKELTQATMAVEQARQELARESKDREKKDLELDQAILGLSDRISENQRMLFQHINKKEP